MFCIVFLTVGAPVNVFAATSYGTVDYIEGPLFFNELSVPQGSGTRSATSFSSRDNYTNQIFLNAGTYYLLNVAIGDGFDYSDCSGVYTVKPKRYFYYDGEEYVIPDSANNSTCILVRGNGQRFSWGIGYELFMSVNGSYTGGSYCHVSCKPHVIINVFTLSASEVASLENNSNIVNGLKDNKASIDKGNQLQQEANQTGKGILGKITDFFGSFFDNIINALKSLFIPEDGYFSDYFNRLNDFFSEKLGFLYSPIDLFVEFLNAIQNASVGSDVGLVFPEIKWEDTVLIEKTTVNFDIVNEKMPDLQQKIYFVTDIIMVGAVIFLLEKKIDEVMQK